MTHERRLTGRHVLFALIAFFGVMLVANAAFVTFAVRSFPGESEKKSYFQGLNYNETLAARATQNTLGWQVVVRRVEPSIVEIALYDIEETGVAGLAISGDIRRPTHSGGDQQLVFEEIAHGVYQATTTTLSDGAWDLSGIAKDLRGNQFEFHARVFVQ